MTQVLDDVLSMLGFVGLETEEDFDVLGLMLSCIHPENILSPEEQEILEDADLSFVGNEVETLVLEGLKSNGIEEEDLNMDDCDREYIENKISSLESFIWDPKIDMLCKQKNQMEKVLKELDRRTSDFHLKQCIQDTEKEWTKIKSCFDFLYEDLQELESSSKNPENAGEFQSFLGSHQNELEKFIEVSNRYLNRVREIKVNLDVSSSLHVNGLEQLLGFNKSLCALQSRLAFAFYNINCKYADSKLLMAGCDRKSSSSEIESVSDKYFLSLFNLCDKWAELHLKENIILPKLDESKALRELSLEICKNLQPILHMQLTHQLLTSVIAHFWVHEQNGSTELIRSTYEHFEEELSNVLSRVSYLEGVQKKLVSFFDSEDYKMSLLERLKTISGSVLSDEDKCIAKKIEEKEKELLFLIHQQNTVLMNGKKQILNLEGNVEQMRRSINSNMRIVSQFQEGYNESKSQLQLRKNNMVEVIEQLVENPVYCKSRLLWVYFLTDHKKLHNFKALADLESPTNINEMSFVTSTPKSCIGTSTPKKQN